MSGGNMRLLVEILGDGLGHFFEMDGGAVLPDNEKSVIAHTLGIDVRA